MSASNEHEPIVKTRVPVSVPTFAQRAQARINDLIVEREEALELLGKALKVARQHEDILNRVLHHKEVRNVKDLDQCVYAQSADGNQLLFLHQVKYFQRLVEKDAVERKVDPEKFNW